MPAGVAFTLPHGVRAGSEWTRDARLHALTGAEEEFLAEEGATLAPAERTTELLARCVDRIGPIEASPETVLQLTIGDREALLLQIRRLTFGDRLEAVVACPSADCGERMDLELSVGDLLVEPSLGEDDWRQGAVARAGSRYTVRYRAPTGADQRDAARLATDLPAAAALVLERCLGGVVDDRGEPVAEVPAAVAEALPELMASCDPQAEILLSLACPACATRFRVLFDAGEYLARELEAQREGLYREVHQLALHYHWSEAEILAMPTGKRRRYLELLADAVQQGAR